MQVRPGMGGQITSLKDRRGREYLAVGYRPRSLTATSPFNIGGLGGIDDCLPAIARGTYPSGSFAGSPIPDHGELWFRPWYVIAVNRASIALRIEGLHLPFTLTRTTRLEAAAVRTAYVLTNDGAEQLPMIWAAHPLFGAPDDLEIDLGDIRSLRREFGRLDVPVDITWPLTRIAGSAVRLDRWSDIPRGLYFKAFAPWVADRPISLRHPDRRVRIEITASGPRPMHLGLWVNRGGFPEARPVTHVALEPTFGSSDDLGRAIEDGTCLIVEPYATVEWSVSYRLAEA